MINKLLLAIIFIVGFVVAYSYGKTINSNTSGIQQPIFQRIVDNQTIRCAYATWYPGFYVDTKTGQKAGYAYDIAETMADRLNIDINWVEEVGWGNAEAGMVTGRYDAACAHFCIESYRLKAANFSRPFYHEPIYLMSRYDDNRLINDPDRANNKDMMVAILPGSIFETTAQSFFPNAKRLDVSQLDAGQDMFLSVNTKKADFMFNTGINIKSYNEKNPNRIKRVGQPVNYCSAGFMLPVNEPQLKNMVDQALEEMLASDEINKIISSYMPDDPSLWMPAKPYLIPDIQTMP